MATRPVTTLCGVDMTGKTVLQVVQFADINLETLSVGATQQLMAIYTRLREVVFGPTLLTTGNAPTLAQLRDGVDNGSGVLQGGIEDAKKLAYDGLKAYLTGTKQLLLSVVPAKVAVAKPDGSAAQVDNPAYLALFNDPVPLA